MPFSCPIPIFISSFNDQKSLHLFLINSVTESQYPSAMEDPTFHHLGEELSPYLSPKWSTTSWHMTSGQLRGTSSLHWAHQASTVKSPLILLNSREYNTSLLNLSLHRKCAITRTSPVNPRSTPSVAGTSFLKRPRLDSMPHVHSHQSGTQLQHYLLQLKASILLAFLTTLSICVATLRIWTCSQCPSDP